MKLVREHINEIFTQNSDPIADMGIGIEQLLKQEYEKIKTHNTYWIYSYATYTDIKFNREKIFKIFKGAVGTFYFNIIKGFLENSKYYQGVFDKEVKKFKYTVSLIQTNNKQIINQGVNDIIERTSKILDKKFGIKIKI